MRVTVIAGSKVYTGEKRYLCKDLDLPNLPRIGQDLCILQEVGFDLDGQVAKIDRVADEAGASVTVVWVDLAGIHKEHQPIDYYFQALQRAGWRTPRKFFN